MITKVRLVNFKNFADETLRLGPFTVIVGANASGKSNVRDAFRFLHGIGRGYTLASIVGGKYGAGGQVEWEQIRGATNEIVRFDHKAFSIITELEGPGGIDKTLRHRIKVGIGAGDRSRFRVTREELAGRRYEATYTSRPPIGDPVREQGDDEHLLLRMAKSGDQKKYGHRLEIRPHRPALTQIRKHKHIKRAHKDEAQTVADALASMRFLDLTPDLMRQPSFPGQDALGDRGENLPTVLQEICADEKRKGVLTEWVQELTPMDVKDFEFPIDPITGQVRLVVRETDDRKVSAYSASDGTLRFLAMLAALLGPDPARLYFFEEIDNGLHPSRLHLLLDLIETQTAKSGIQVVTTTHSPELLSMMSDRTFKNASVVCRLPDSTDAVIRSVSEIPQAAKLRKTQGLGRLLAGGWMETALAFTEGDDAEGSG